MTPIPDSQLLDLKEKEIIEKMARAICDEWGYLWDCDDPEDEQCCGDDAELYDERPSKELFRRAAAKAFACTSSLVDEIVELRKDAARYRFLRPFLTTDGDVDDPDMATWFYSWLKIDDEHIELPDAAGWDSVDAAIDAALQAGGKDDPHN